MHSFQQFVYEYLDFGWKPVCIKFHHDLLNEFKRVPEVSWIAQVQAVDDTEQQGTSCGDIFDSREHLHTFNDDAHIFWKLINICTWMFYQIDADDRLLQSSLVFIRGLTLKTDKKGQDNLIKSLPLNSHEIYTITLITDSTSEVS